MKRLLSLFVGFVFAGLTICAQQQFTESTRVYVMHSSGNHLKMGDDKAGRLESPSATNPQMITLIPDGQGYYSLKADGESLFLSLSGSWNTLFVSDSTSANTKYAIEKASGNYVKLRCKANNKYLGTDASDPESKVFSDKNGNSSLHHWFFANEPTAELPADTIAYLVEPNLVRQSFDGWGVSLCWWANMCGKWDDDKIDELVTWMVSPEGLNYNIFRYNIGGGDDPQNRNCTIHHMGNGKGLRAEMEGFKDYSDDVYHWERDEAQRKIMLKIHEKRPDAIFEAFSNSAPYYMTYSGCVSGNVDASMDNLKPEYYEEFAHYLVDVCKHYKDVYDIEFKTLAPFNEPMTNYWSANGGQEGCHFSVSSQMAFLRVLQPILQSSGLSTVISSSDETDVSQSVKDITSYQNGNVLSMLGQWNTHTYQHSINSRTKLAFLAHQTGMPLWMSEVGAKGDLSLAQVLIDDMRYLQPNAWVDWQYMEENGSTWGVIGGNFSNQTYYRMKKYYTRQQCSRFIKPGYDIVTSLNNQSLAALSPSHDTLVIVLLNDGEKVIHRINLKAFESIGNDIIAYRTSDNENMALVSDYMLNDDMVIDVVLPAQSITTLMVPVSVNGEDFTQLRTDCDYLIVPRNETTRCVAVADDGTLKLEDIDGKNPRTWRLTLDGTNYRFTNKEGLTITANLYATTNVLTAESASTDIQSFIIETIDFPYCKIVSSVEPQYAMELVSEKTTSGTSVKLWPYDDGSAPTHRQWMLVPVIEQGNTSINNIVKSDAHSNCIGDGVYSITGHRLYVGKFTASDIDGLASGIYIVVKNGQVRKYIVR